MHAHRRDHAGRLVAQAPWPIGARWHRPAKAAHWKMSSCAPSAPPTSRDLEETSGPVMAGIAGGFFHLFAWMPASSALLGFCLRPLMRCCFSASLGRCMAF